MTKPDVTPFPGVGKRPDANTYQFSLRVPKDVQQHFSGPWAVRCSLGTADLRTANDKAKTLHAEWAARFAALRSGKPAPVDLAALRVGLLAYAVDTYLPAIDQLSAGYSAAERADRARSVDHDWQDVLQGIAKGYIADAAEQWLPTVLRKLGVPHTPVSEAEALPFLAMLLELHHEALTDTSRAFPLRVQRLAERRALLAAGDSVAPPVASRSTPAPRVRPATVNGHRIADALAEWKGTKTKAKTIGTFTRHAAQFAELMGDPVLEALDRAQAIQFRDKLQAWAIANGKTARTADDALGNVRALVNVARDRGWIDGNPLERLTVKVGGKESEGREPWTHDELRTLFDDPIWREYRLPSASKAGADAAYWLPLMAAYTGARVSELAQLWTDDITTDKGAEVIEFRDNAERGQGLKNDGSWRAVPMNSELVRLGLPEYIASLPTGPLFPDLPKAGQNGPGGQFANWFGTFKRGKGFASPAKSMHSFRHLVATELRLKGATDPQADGITGHAGEGVARGTYSATIRREAERLRPVIELLQFNALQSLPVCSRTKVMRAAP